MLLDKGKAQTKYKKNDTTDEEQTRIELKTASVRSLSCHNVTTRSIKVKRLPVVNISIFSSFKVKKSAARNPLWHQAC